MQYVALNMRSRFAAVQQYPPVINMQNARAEAEMVMFESVAKALKKTNLRPNQVIADSELGQHCC